MQILAVEPDQTDRLILKKHLSSFGSVTTLSSAREALRFAATQRFDLLIVNRTLITDVDSVTLLKALRQISPYSFTAVATTAFYDNARNAVLISGGFSAVVIKPVTSFNFHDVISAHNLSFFDNVSVIPR